MKTAYVMSCCDDHGEYELSETSHGRYRVRSIWDGKISFEIMTKR